MSAAASTELARNPATGEVLDLSSADTGAIAAAVDEVEQMRGRLSDFASAAADELLARLDRNASWRLRVGSPHGDCQFEISAPSPDAGTTGYDERVLERELAALIDDGAITAHAAEAALERTVTITLRVPFNGDLAELAALAKDIDGIAGVPCTAAKVTAARRVVAQGVNALRKVPGTGAALDRAKVTLTPTRKARVKAIRKERS